MVYVNKIIYHLTILKVEEKHDIKFQFKCEVVYTIPYKRKPLFNKIGSDLFLFAIGVYQLKKMAKYDIIIEIKRSKYDD